MAKFLLLIFLFLNIYAKPMVTYIIGDSPIILTSPHGESPKKGIVPEVELRKNSTIKGFKTIWDTNTKKITKEIRKILINKYNIKPYVIIANFNRAYIDANRKPTHAYETEAAKKYYDAYHNSIKQAIRAVRKKYKEGLLIDIHGQKFNPDVIYLGTLNKKGIKRLTKRFPNMNPIYAKVGIHSTLSKFGYNVIPKKRDTKEKKYKGGYTIHRYGSHHKKGIDSIQIEIGKNLRSTKKDYLHVAGAIAKSIYLHVNNYLQ